MLANCRLCKKSSPEVVLSKDGLYRGSQLYSCRSCNTERLKKYRSTPEGRRRVFAAVYRSIRNNPEKQRARTKVRQALSRGTISKPEICLNCPEKKVEAHHVDYSQPLNVIWMCRACHRNFERAHLVLKN